MKSFVVAARILLLVVLFSTLLVIPSFASDHLHIFLYHRFGDQRYPTTNISLVNFSEQMHYLQDQGYRVIRAGEAVELLRKNEPIPPKTVVLTVDDTYKTFITGAMPILRQYGFPVTLFVNTDSVGAKDYLDWNDLRFLAKEGVEIGNHTATHQSLTDQKRGESLPHYQQRLRKDLDRAQTALTRELGLSPKLFAYPFGEYSQLTQEIIEEYGFLGAFGQQSGVTGRTDSLYSLPRTPLAGSFATLSQMKQKLRLRPMPIKVIAPLDTLIGEENPPTLVLEILDPQLAAKDLRLFVNGQPGGIIQKDALRPQRITVRADNALGTGRNRYILTAPGRETGTFYALTQFWLKRSRP